MRTITITLARKLKSRLTKDCCGDDDCGGSDSTSVGDFRTCVAVYLDRCMFNRVALLNRDYYHQTSLDDGGGGGDNNNGPSSSYYISRPWPSQRRFRVGSRAFSVAFSYDGRTIACGTDNGTVQIWYCSNGRHATLSTTTNESSRILGGNSNINSHGHHRRRGARGAAYGSGGTNTMASRVTCVAYHPSSFVTLLAASGEDGKIRLWKEGCAPDRGNEAVEPTVPAASGGGLWPPKNDKQRDCGSHWHPAGLLQARGTVSCVVFVPPNYSSSRSTCSTPRSHSLRRHVLSIVRSSSLP